MAGFRIARANVRCAIDTHDTTAEITSSGLCMRALSCVMDATPCNRRRSDGYHRNHKAHDGHRIRFDKHESLQQRIGSLSDPSFIKLSSMLIN